MSYVGNIPAEKYSSLTQQTFSSPTGTNFVLSQSVTNNLGIVLIIDNVRQDPAGASYTAVGTSLVLSEAISSPSTMYCLFNGKTTETVSPPAGSVDSSHIVAGAVDDSHISGLSASKLTGSLPASMNEITKSSSDPTASTNPAGGVGTVFLNTTSGEMFSLTDATAGSNVWTNIGDGTGGLPITYMSATGGTITTDGSYKVHTFNSSGTFTPTIGTVASVGNVVEYLVIAGGGGGCDSRAGAGGAGGYRNSYASEASGGGGSSESSFTVTNSSLTVTVGAGGSKGQGSAGTGGSNSVFDSIISIGGGFTPYPQHSTGGIGGSGSGGASETGAGGAGTANQGYAGGTSNSSPGGGSAGGGGAGGVGQGSTTGVGGAGGIGLTSSITGSAVARGGGGGGSGPSNGAGTSGGATGDSGVNATVNTGGGGAGGWNGNESAGGSGVVIIRYQFQA